MPNTYLVVGKDGVTRKFMGDVPPTDEEQAAIEQVDANHPARTWGDTARAVAGAMTSALPMAGAAVGGALATPETLGAGTLPGAAFGGMAGEAFKQLLDRAAGLNAPPTSPMQAIGQLGVSGLRNGVGATVGQGLGVAAGPVINAAKGIPADLLEQATKNPAGITVGKTAAGVVKRLAAGASATPPSPILDRPAWQTWGDPVPQPTGGLSAADKALLARQGYTPELIQRVEQDAIAARAAKPPMSSPAPTSTQVSAPQRPQSPVVPETGETEAAWRARVQAQINAGNSPAKPSGYQGPVGRLTGTKAPSVNDAIQDALNELRGQAPLASPSRPPITVSPSSPMQPPSGDSPLAQQLKASLAARAPAPVNPASSGAPVPLYGSTGGVKGATSNALEAASNAALAAGHWDEAERLIGQSLHSFFQGSGGPMAGILAAAIAHKARQVVEPLRADPTFQQAPPARQQQLIQQALRQPGARGSLNTLLGSGGA